MLLRKWNVQLIAAMFVLAFASTTAHETAPAQPQDKVIPYNLKNEADNTDALAIPSDSSEAEQEAEMKEMKSLEKAPAPVVAPVAPVTK